MEGKAKVKGQAVHPFVELRHSDFVQSTITSKKSRWMDLTHWGSETLRRFVYERDAGPNHQCLRDCQNLLLTSLSSFSRFSTCHPGTSLGSELRTHETNRANATPR